MGPARATTTSLWFDTPAATIAWRDTRSITPALERMAENPDVFFSMESVLYLLEYLQRHPERLEELHSLVTGKRFDWGATHNQPYESLLSGEQLVREVYFGRRLLRNLLPGADPPRVLQPGRSWTDPADAAGSREGWSSLHDDFSPSAKHL